MEIKSNLKVYLDITEETIHNICYNEYAKDVNNEQLKYDLFGFLDLPLSDQLPLIKLGCDMARYNYLDYIRSIAGYAGYTDIIINLDSELCESCKNNGYASGEYWGSTEPILSFDLKTALNDYVNKACKFTIYSYKNNYKK